MIKIKLYDNIVLKDGRKASVVEIFDESNFLVDVEVDDDYDTIDVTLEDIDRVID